MLCFSTKKYIFVLYLIIILDGNTFIVNSECLVEHILLHLK